MNELDYDDYEQTNSIIKKYLINNFKIYSNETELELDFLGYERKNYSYDSGEVTNYTYAGKSEGNLDNFGTIDDATSGTTFDEEADYITLTYRHQF